MRKIMILFIWNPNLVTERAVITWDQRDYPVVGLTAKEHKGTFWGEGNILYFVCGDSYIFNVFVKTHQTIHLIWAYIIACKLYFNKV